MANFNNLTNNEAKKVITAILKGIVHSTVVPLMILLLINIDSDEKLGLYYAIAYIVIVGIGYNFVATKKDISKHTFNFTVSTVFGFALLFLGLGSLSAFN